MAKFNKIAAFGAGSGLNDLLTLMPDNVELVAIGDNDANCQGRKVRGVSVVAATDIAQIECDAIVITASAVDPVRRQLIELGVSPEKIIALCPSASVELVGQANADLLRLNEGLSINLPEAGIATMYLRSEGENPRASAWPVDYVRNQAFTLCAEQILASLIHDARFRARSGHLLRLAVLRGRPASLAFVSPHSD